MYKNEFEVDPYIKLIGIEPTSKKTNGPLWNEQLAKSWNTELVSLATPGATFCKSNRKNASWLQKQVESYTSKDGQETVHAMFLGVTDLIETKGEGKQSTLLSLYILLYLLFYM